LNEGFGRHLNLNSTRNARNRVLKRQWKENPKKELLKNTFEKSFSEKSDQISSNSEELPPMQT
jgi:hypothetical protein